MPEFNPVEAQQHIDLVHDWAAGATQLEKTLVSNLESAVEYIAGMEEQLVEVKKIDFKEIDIRDGEIAALEAEVARLNGVIERDKQVIDSVDSWIELANRYETKLNAVHAYINEFEHPDNWGVPCVYTEDLRDILVTPVSTEPEKEN